MSLVVNLNALKGILPLCLTDCAKELDLHGHEVRVLRELDWLLPEGSRHDEDVLGGSLEVDIEGDRLI